MSFMNVLDIKVSPRAPFYYSCFTSSLRFCTIRTKNSCDVAHTCAQTVAKLSIFIGVSPKATFIKAATNANTIETMKAAFPFNAVVVSLLLSHVTSSVTIEARTPKIAIASRDIFLKLFFNATIQVVRTGGAGNYPNHQSKNRALYNKNPCSHFPNIEFNFNMVSPSTMLVTGIAIAS